MVKHHGLPFIHSYLTSVHWDVSGLSQEPPTTVIFIQLLTIEWYNLRTVSGTISSSRWMIQVSSSSQLVRTQVKYSLSVSFDTYLIYEHWGISSVCHQLLSCWRWSTILFTGVYPLLENLKLLHTCFRHHHFLRYSNDPFHGKEINGTRDTPMIVVFVR